MYLGSRLLHITSGIWYLVSTLHEFLPVWMQLHARILLVCVSDTKLAAHDQVFGDVMSLIGLICTV